jgi:hypothetical protein
MMAGRITDTGSAIDIPWIPEVIQEPSVWQMEQYCHLNCHLYT